MRGLQEVGWQDVKAIRDAIAANGMPTYNDYMAQIAANTYNSAMSSQAILDELRSVIGSAGSIGGGVRVYVQ